jgi:hypothetical protein
MAAKRIPDLTAIAGASTANNDNLVIFDTDANETKRILRSQLALALAGDLGGASGSFTTVDGKTVTVSAGLITSIV